MENKHFLKACLYSAILNPGLPRGFSTFAFLTHASFPSDWQASLTARTEGLQILSLKTDGLNLLYSNTPTTKGPNPSPKKH